jgi:hypothetical protein
MNPNGLYAYQYYLQRGYSPQAAAGIAGNLHAESSFNTGASGDNGTAYGLAQWRGARLQGLKDYAQATGQDYRSMDAQLGYVDHEMRTGSDAGAARAFQQLQTAQTPADAAAAFMRNYERPNANPNINNIAGRQSFANSLLGVDPSTLPTAAAQQPLVNAPVTDSGIASLVGPSVAAQAGASLPTVQNADPMGGIFGLLLQNSMTQQAPVAAPAPQPIRRVIDERSPDEKMAAVSETPNVYLDRLRQRNG